MKKNRKKILIGIFVFSALLILSGITYTWFKWRSNDDVNVRITIDNSSDLVINFDGGENITGVLEPTYTKEEGIIKTFSANTNGTCVPIKYWLKLNSLPDVLKNSTLKWELHSNGTVSYGDFSLDNISFNTDNGNTDYYLYSDIVCENVSNYTLYLWMDGNVDNDFNMASKSFDFDLYATVSSDYSLNAAAYISTLYHNNPKEEIVNGIEYNYARSVSLMNDRHASTATDINGGDIRYYGNNPNNYVWLGDTYTSTYTFTSDDSSITRNVGDKKLWRIIGVFDGRLKLISNDPISGVTELSWDTSENNTTGGNSGYGINQWGESTYSDTGEVYQGADLMRLLNPGYEEESINNSLYWNKGTGTVYTGRSNATTTNVSFANTGLSSTEKNMIDTATWYLGTFSCNGSYAITGNVSSYYSCERQSTYFGKYCQFSSDTQCNDKVVRTATWVGKVGLPYESDFGYSADFKFCKGYLDNYNNSSCSNWLSTGNNWTLTTYRYPSRADIVYYNYSTKSSAIGMFVRPAVYLKQNVIITGGNGKESSPYILTLE